MIVEKYQNSTLIHRQLLDRSPCIKFLFGVAAHEIRRVDLLIHTLLQKLLLQERAATGPLAF